MKNILIMVEKVNKHREMSRLPRRIIKLGEEKGELDQAYLHVSSQKNSKNKSWDDVREEAIDSAIVALDIALTKFPSDVKKSDKQIREEILSYFEKKLDKWQKNLKTNSTATESVDDSI